MRSEQVSDLAFVLTVFGTLAVAIVAGVVGTSRGRKMQKLPSSDKPRKTKRLRKQLVANGLLIGLLYISTIAISFDQPPWWLWWILTVALAVECAWAVELLIGTKDGNSGDKLE
jgi:hypothetical protein